MPTRLTGGAPPPSVLDRRTKRQRHPQDGEGAQGDGPGYGRGTAAVDHERHAHQSQTQQHEPGIGQPVRGRHQGLEPVLAEQDPVHRNGGHQRQRRGDRTRHGRGVDAAHQFVEPVETLLKGQGQQESGQQLNAGLCHSQLLEQGGPITVQPFGFGLRTGLVIPVLVSLGVVDIHDVTASSARRTHCATPRHVDSGLSAGSGRCMGWRGERASGFVRGRVRHPRARADHHWPPGEQQRDCGPAKPPPKTLRPPDRAVVGLAAFETAYHRDRSPRPDRPALDAWTPSAPDTRPPRPPSRCVNKEHGVYPAETNPQTRNVIDAPYATRRSQ
jgi:hypothetical protein